MSAAAKMVSAVGSRAPNAMLLAIESENSMGSCSAMPIRPRSSASGNLRTSRPPMRTEPEVTSHRRGNRETNTVFPLPVGPVMPTRVPSGTVRQTSSSSVAPPAVTVTWSNTTSPPAIGAGAAAGTGSAMAGARSNTSRIRSQLAHERWRRLITQPSESKGHCM